MKTMMLNSFLVSVFLFEAKTELRGGRGSLLEWKLEELKQPWPDL